MAQLIYSVPDPFCGDCDATVTGAIESVFNTIGKVVIKKSEYSNDFLISFDDSVLSRYTLDQLSSLISEEIDNSGFPAYRPGCDLVITTLSPQPSQYQPNKWYLVYQNEGWKLLQVNVTADQVKEISMMNVPDLKELLTNKKFSQVEENEEVIRNILINFQNQTRRKILRSYKIKTIVGIVLGGVIIVASIPFLHITLPMVWVASVSTAANLYIGGEAYYQFIQACLGKSAFKIDALFALSSFTALVVSIVSIFIPMLNMMLFDTALLIFGARYAGLWIEETAKQNVDSEPSYSDRARGKVKVLREDKEVTTTVQKLQVGDIISIKAGQVVPIDGEVITGECNVYTTIVDGETSPHLKKSLKAGMKITRDSNPDTIEIRVTATASESHLAQLDRSVYKERKNRRISPTTANKVAKYLLPFTCGFSLVTGLLLGIFFPWTLVIKVVISMLVSMCPCALGLIEKLGDDVAVKKLEDQGILVWDRDVLHAARNIKVVAFDLTGTLTVSKQIVNDIKTFVDEKTIPGGNLQLLIQNIEKHSKSDVAKAICAHTNPEIKLPHTAYKVKIEDEYRTGIKANIDNCTYYIGNSTLMSQHFDINSCNIKLDPGKIDKIIYIGRILPSGDKQLIGCVTIFNPLRPEAKNTIDKLIQSGKKVCICTGTDEPTANACAKQIGLNKEDVQAECSSIALPAESKEGSQTTISPNKPDFIKGKQQKYDGVAMVGEGSNDGPALATSDVGIVIGSESSDTTTHRKAGVYIPSLKSLNILFDISSQIHAHKSQNYVCTFICNALTMVLPTMILVVFGITIPPYIGAMLMAVPLIIVQYRNQRFRHQPISELPESYSRTQNTTQSMNHGQIMSRLGGSPVPAKNMGDSFTASSSSKPLFEAIQTKPKISNKLPGKSISLQSPSCNIL